MKHKGTLIITEENQNNFKKLTEISGYIYVSENATFTAPKLEKSGYIDVRANATFTAPKLTEISGYIDVRANATFTAPKLEKSGYIYVSENATFTAPKLTEISGYIYVRANATFTAPKLEKSGYIYVSENATFTAPKLEKSGSIYVSENATFTAPKLEKSGYIDVRANATFTAPKLKIQNNIARFNNKTYKIVHNDGITFFVENEKTSKGIKIYSGLINLKIENNIVKGEKTFLTEKEGFSSHGKTLKKSISDLHFKIVAEKLRKEPINKDTIITDGYYHTVTGACELGIEHWRKQNNIEVESITAKDLLPLLESTNAYGYDKFKSLITF